MALTHSGQLVGESGASDPWEPRERKVSLTRSRENVDAAAERLARTAQGSCEMLVEHAVTLGERNVRFAEDMVIALVREYRRQTEANLSIMQDLFERAEQQSDDLQTVANESLEAYADLFYAPFRHHGKGFGAARKTVG